MALIVSSVTAASAADHAGLKVGDVIQTINGRPVNQNNDVLSAKNIKSGEAHKLTVLRNGESLQIEIPNDVFGFQTNPYSIDKSEGQSLTYKSNYATTQKLCSIFAIIGWIGVGIGLLVAFTSFGQRGPMVMAQLMTGLGISFSGLIGVMGSQITKATIDNADHTRQILLLLGQKT